MELEGLFPQVAVAGRCDRPRETMMNPDTPGDPPARTLEERVAELEREVAVLSRPTRGTISGWTGLCLAGARTFCFLACIGVVIGGIKMMGNTLNSLPVQRGGEIDSADLWMLAGDWFLLALAGFLALCFFAGLEIVFAQVEGRMRRKSEGGQAPWKGCEPNDTLQQPGPA